MFQEFLALLIIAVILAIIYKFRHELMGWLHTKPRMVRSGILRDLEVLKRHKVDNAVERIVDNEREWEEAAAKLEKELKQMKKEIHDKYKEKTETQS